MEKKIKILWCTDSPCVETGFGRVSSELITRLLKTGRYEIHVMGTNDLGEPHPLRGAKDLFIYPLTDLQQDPYGIRTFPMLLRKVNPDLVFALNDIWVWTGDEKHPGMDHWFYRHMKEFKPFIPWVGYFAVDGRPWEQRWVDCVNMMTRAVVFSNYGWKVLHETPGIDFNKIRLIYHGSATDKFYPLPQEERSKFRKEAWGIQNDDVFVVGCVNRNQPRKNIPRLIHIFKCFSDGYGICRTCKHPAALNVLPDCEICGDTVYSEVFPGVGTQNTFLYLHMNLLDMRGHRLPKVAQDAKLNNIIAPANFNVAAGVPLDELNRVYNALDVHVSTTYAGGWELTTPESQCAGTPNVGTRSTCMTEHLDDGKGFPVLPETFVTLDDANHCHKHPISFRGLLDTLNELYYDKEKRLSVVEKARAYALDRNWDKPAEQFDQVFQEALQERIIVTDQFKEPENIKKILLINSSLDPGILFSMIPLFRAIKKKYNPCELALACNPKSSSLVQNNRNLDHILDCDKLVFEGELKNANIQDVSHAIAAFNQNSARFSHLSYEEIWLQSFRMPTDNLELEIFFDKEDKKFVKQYIKNTTKKKLALCIDAENPTLSLPMEKWAEVINLLDKFDELETYVLNTDKIDPRVKFENITIIPRTSARKMAAIVDMCDFVLTMDNTFVLIAKALEKKLLIIQGPRDATAKLGNYKNYEIISMKEFFNQNYGCMPCWINPGEKCLVSNSPTAVCLNQINPVEIFGRILTAFNQLEEEVAVSA